jgi:hypothetical protein
LRIVFPRVCRAPPVVAGFTLEAAEALFPWKVLPQDPLAACAWKGRLNWKGWLAGDGDLPFLFAVLVEEVLTQSGLRLELLVTGLARVVVLVEEVLTQSALGLKLLVTGLARVVVLVEEVLA